MQGAFFQSFGARFTIDFVHQRRIRSRHKHIGRVILEVHAHAANKSTLRKVAQQRPEIHKTGVQVLVKDAGFGF